jgi:hypothetical protein
MSVVADFGGPGNIVTPEVGYKIALMNEGDLIRKIETILKHLAGDRNHIETLRQRSMAYARQHLTWDGKALAVTKVLRWVAGHGPKPAMQPPERLSCHGL